MAKKYYLLAPLINHCRHIPTKCLFSIFIVFLFVFSSYAQPKEEKLKPLVKEAVFALSNVMMHDVVSPVIASRYYMYCTIGANAIISFSGKSLHPSKYIQHFPSNLGTNSMADPSLAALFSIYQTGMIMLPSGMNMLESYIDVKKKVASFKYSSSEINAAEMIAANIAKEILKYASEDGYSKLSTFTKYRPKRKDGYWFPTPPAYMDAVDPHWRTMRTMMIDSANQFPGLPPAPFDTSVNSLFFKLTSEVYNIGKSPSTEEKEIAAFWDCNPFVVATAGHMSLGYKKISPGGHWMNIVSIACISEKIPFYKMIQSLSIEAIGLYDAFIVCWNEKYKSERARPETIINKFIDVKWQPMLQTPPFPEYTSGHSVISSTSAELLSFLIGENVRFTDDSEVIFELPARTFNSFRAAANEASVSRLYGGIHYRDAIENGQDQGKRVGAYMIQKLKLAGLK